MVVGWTFSNTRGTPGAWEGLNFGTYFSKAETLSQSLHRGSNGEIWGSGTTFTLWMGTKIASSIRIENVEVGKSWSSRWNNYRKTGNPCNVTFTPRSFLCVRFRNASPLQNAFWLAPHSFPFFSCSFFCKKTTFEIMFVPLSACLPTCFHPRDRWMDSSKFEVKWFLGFISDHVWIFIPYNILPFDHSFLQSCQHRGRKFDSH